MTPPVAIAAYSEAYAPHFARLNRAWIERYFAIEPIDHAVLGDPHSHILSKGGEIWFALQGDTPVGCYALLRHEGGRWEFTKFAVDDAAQGAGIGKALLAHAIARADALEARDIIIYTHSSLAAACGLYRKAGWQDIPMSAADRARYRRADTMLLYTPTGR